MLGHPLCAPLRVLLTWLQAVEMFLCVKGGWLPELSLQPQNSHPTFCLGPPQWPTPSNRAPEAHRPTTIEPVCLWVLNETNSQSLRPNTPLSWFSDTHWGTIWILALNISLPLDFFAWTSCLGLRLWIQLVANSAHRCQNTVTCWVFQETLYLGPPHLGATADSSQAAGSHLGSK